MGTAKVTIQDGTIICGVMYNHTGVHYGEIKDDDGKEMYLNGWTVNIYRNQIIAHSECRYPDGIHKCYKEFKLQDGILGLSSGKRRYCFFRKPEFQAFLDKFEIDSVKREDPYANVLSDPSNSICGQGLNWAIVQVPGIGNTEGSTILYSLEQNVMRLEPEIRKYFRRLEAINELNASKYFKTMAECREFIEVTIKGTFEPTSAEMPGVVKRGPQYWTAMKFNNIEFSLNEHRASVVEGHEFSSFEEVREYLAPLGGITFHYDHRYEINIGLKYYTRYESTGGTIFIGNQKIGEFNF